MKQLGSAFVVVMFLIVLIAGPVLADNSWRQLFGAGLSHSILDRTPESIVCSGSVNDSTLTITCTCPAGATCALDYSASLWQAAPATEQAAEDDEAVVVGDLDCTPPDCYPPSGFGPYWPKP
jgi:hypothetical protein